jgi:tetratricopeptide (TPR) repeat protein
MKENKSWIMRIIAICVLGALVLVMPLFTQKDLQMGDNRLIERFKRANPLFLDGAKQFNKGKLEMAEKKFLETLEIMPEHADAAYMLAKLHLQKKEFSKALASIVTAEKNYTYIAQFQTLTHQQYLDSLRQQQLQLDDQLNFLQGALASLPSSATAEQKAPIERDIKKLNQTKQMIQSRLTSPIAPTDEIPADYFFIHGNVFFQSGQLAEAAAQYQEALRLDPTHGNAYNNLALVSYSQGKYRKALDFLLRAEAAKVKINPDFKRAVMAKIPPQ